MSENLVSDYAVRLATLGAMGGDTTAQYKSVYEIDKEILRLTQEGGGGISEAPEDGSIYGRKDGDWTKVVAESGLQPVIVDELPTTGESGKMYFVPNDDPGVQDNYKEYIWVNNAWECVGNANVDLTDYAKVVSLTQAEYDALTTKDVNTMYNITDATPFVVEDYYKKTESDAKYNPIKTTTSSGSGYKFTYWNGYGQITGAATTVYAASLSINGSARSIISTSSSSMPSIYAPTTAGTKGYVLTSNGSGAPVWTEYKSDATAYISEQDCIDGTYSTEIMNFYKDCIKSNHIGPVQLFTVTEHTVEEETYDAYSYYLPSSSRLFEGNVELWFFATEDGVNWTNRHILITNAAVSSDVTNGTFGSSTL